MIITDPKELERFSSSNRKWQGIPSIEATAKGRIFACWYSGGVTEENGNYCLLVKSDDQTHFSEPVAVAYCGENARAFDSTLWIDPLGRLWFFWALMPSYTVEYAICENPDAEELVWSDVKTLAHGVMLNKPTAATSGEWLFPVAYWEKRFINSFITEGIDEKETGAYVYAACNQTENFVRRGKVIAQGRWFDEHVLLEKQDGSIDLFVRTSKGISRAASFDNGMTFGEAEHFMSGPNSRFAVRRLPSGKILIVNHVDFTGRNNLTAMLCDEDYNVLGSLLLDGRNGVSYPDVAMYNGFIYIIYDRERGAIYNKNIDYSDEAREILIAKVTEEDIMRGECRDGMLKMTVNRLN